MKTSVGLFLFNGQESVANPSDPEILLSILSSPSCGHAKNRSVSGEPFLWVYNPENNRCNN